jgi:hypothetical protein
MEYLLSGEFFESVLQKIDPPVKRNNFFVAILHPVKEDDTSSASACAPGS